MGFGCVKRTINDHQGIDKYKNWLTERKWNNGKDGSDLKDIILRYNR